MCMRTLSAMDMVAVPKWCSPRRVRGRGGGVVLVEDGVGALVYAEAGKKVRELCLGEAKPLVQAQGTGGKCAHRAGGERRWSGAQVMHELIVTG